jgi:hypothetical protein
MIGVVYADDLPACHVECYGVRVADFAHHLIGPVFQLLFG